MSKEDVDRKRLWFEAEGKSLRQQRYRLEKLRSALFRCDVDGLYDEAYEPAASIIRHIIGEKSAYITMFENEVVDIIHAQNHFKHL